MLAAPADTTESGIVFVGLWLNEITWPWHRPSRHSVTQRVDADQEVPRAAGAYLDDIDAEASVRSSEATKVSNPDCPATQVAEVLTVGVADVTEPGSPTGRAGVTSRLAMKARSLEEVVVRVAELAAEAAAAEQSLERSPSIQ